MAVPFALLSLAARLQQPKKWMSLETCSVGSRIAQALYSPVFFVFETFVPYRLPPHFDEGSLLAAVFLVLTPILSIAFFCLRHRSRAMLACWLFMLALLTPVVGLFQVASYFMGDRYSYLAGLSWVVLGGGILLRFLQVSTQTRREKRRSERQRLRPSALRATALATVILGVVAALTWERSKIWKNPVALWTHVLKVDPNSSNTVQRSRSYEHVAIILHGQGRHAEAVSYQRRAVAAQPDSPDMRNT